MPGEECTVGGDYDTIGVAEARSVLSWWLDSGVDAAVQNAPRNWLKPAPTSPRPAAQPQRSNVTQPSHETLAELQSWLAGSAQVPLASATAKRILPRGPENAPVMLLSDAPALEDFTAGQPIGGEAWVLAGRMLRAIGIDAEQAYSASLSCFHAPGARMSEEERLACAELARRHIALARPQRLILFGDGPCLALLGKRMVEARGHAHKVEGVRAVATFHPRHLLKRPSDKVHAWKDLLLLMEDEV